MTEELNVPLQGNSALSATLFSSTELFRSETGTTLKVTFPEEIRAEGLDLQRISLTPVAGGYPLTLIGFECVYSTKAFGFGSVQPLGFELLSGVWPASVVAGDYLVIESGSNLGRYRITSILTPTLVQIDRPLIDDGDAPIDFSITSAVIELNLTTTKATNGATYRGSIRATTKDGVAKTFTGSWLAEAAKPKLHSVALQPEGALLVEFNEPMRFDAAVVTPAEYTITGPTSVTVLSVNSVSSTQVALKVNGLGVGLYTLEVNAAGTPHDVAGNPIDPLFNTVAFTGAISVNARSVFTDKGPIARPPLDLRLGVNAQFVNFTDVQVPTGTLSSDLVGKYLKLTGSGKNDNDYFILGVLSPTRLRVKASFSLPDTAATTWSIYDPRDGQIADDPAHVSVRVNGTPVQAESVIGLLGQVVLPFVPAPADDVKIDYSWVRNPTVDFARLNSKEFRFNNWNRDLGRPADTSSHKYRYNNVLLEPSSFTPAQTLQQGTGVTVDAPNQLTLTGSLINSSFVGLSLSLSDGSLYRIDSVLSTTAVTVSPAILVGPYTTWAILDQSTVVPAILSQPYQRELHYRAYERAYTAIFNDPNLLVFNSPIHKVAYPPLERRVSSSFVNYDPIYLPENNPKQPWDRFGVGTATLFANELYVDDTTSGPFPDGQPLFWRRTLDLTFPHVIGMAWRMYITSVPVYQGVFTGVAAGYTTDKRAIIVGYLEDAGVKKFGVLKRGYGDDPSNLSAWTGGLDSYGDSTGAPATIDWNIVHSYRVFRSRDGIVKVFLDGEVVETLRVYEEDLPFLEELNAPFNEVQQSLWGSISRPARSTSVWNFVRYQIIPTNPFQTEPGVFVSYEGNILPENAPPPWTPIGYHGTESVKSSAYLLLESTSATDLATETKVGLVGGDFRGFLRIEPLLAVSSDVVLDVNLCGFTSTHGVAPNAVMAAIDDGDRLTQLSFLTSKAAPKLGWGGRSFPTQWTPTPWSATGSATAEMLGRILRIDDASTTNGLVYAVFDTADPLGDARVFAAGNDYAVELRCQVRSYTPDVSGFVGVTADVYDGTRTLGILLQEVAGVRQVALHSDGVVKATFALDWFDAQAHTFRLTKRYDVLSGTYLVSVFADSTLLGSVDYSVFDVPGGDLTGVLSFGTATYASKMARSATDWHYVNSWRIWPSQNYYVGIWKGFESNSLIGYHLPLKTQGTQASVVGNVLTDLGANFLATVVAGDVLIVDSGDNKGTYNISNVLNATTLVVDVATPFPSQPSVVAYRIPVATDWTTYHRYRLSRLPSGSVTVVLDTEQTPLIQVDYSNVTLPSSRVGVPFILSSGLPSITWGAFDPTNLSSTSWDYVRYGITRSASELRIVPHHQVMNQRNVIASPEHLRTNLRHEHSDFWSSSTGIPPQMEPDLLRDAALLAYTQLNEGTPLVPRTQTSEVRVPTPIKQFVAAFNRPEDVLNRDGDFKLNDGAMRWHLLVPDDVLYNSLEVIEQMTGTQTLIAPFGDECEPHAYSLEWQKEVCLAYDGSTLPENAPNQPTPWVFASDNPIHVTRSAFSGVLTFGTDITGTRAIYRNSTPLPDSPSLETKVTFRMKVLSDGTYGLGDSQVRLGFSSTGMTVALAFVTYLSGKRYVAVLDLNAKRVLGGIPFDFLDGQSHTYELVRRPGFNEVTVSVVN